MSIQDSQEIQFLNLKTIFVKKISPLNNLTHYFFYVLTNVHTTSVHLQIARPNDSWLFLSIQQNSTQFLTPYVILFL